MIIARTSIYETNLIIILLIKIIILARCTSFVYPGSVWWHCFAVWWRHRLPYTTPSTKTNDNVHLADFQQRVSAMPKTPQRLRGKYIEFDETSHCPPFKKLSKRDDQLSSKDNVATTRERVLSKYLYLTMSKQWTSSYSRSESPSVAESTTVATASRSDIHDVTD